MFGCLVWVGQTGFVEATLSSLYRGHRYPVEIISHCVWLYHRFPLSLREVEEMMLARGVLVTYESIHQWCRKFGQAFANGLRRCRLRPGDKWHLDEVFIKIKGKAHYLWRAVDQDGNVLDILVTSHRDSKAATSRVGSWRGSLDPVSNSPRQTGHAVLPHPAFRHRSPSGMYRPVTDRSIEAVYAEALFSGVVEPLTPVVSLASFFPAGKDGQSFVDIRVDRGEFPRGVLPPKVRTPTPQYRVEIRYYGVDRSAHVMRSGPCPNRSMD